MLVRCLIALLWVLHWLPFAVLARLGALLGRLMHALPSSRKRVGRINLALCFPALPAAEREQLLRQHFVAIAQMLVEYGYCWFASRERLMRMVRIEGLEHLRQQQGRPVVLSMPHFAGLDLCGLRLSLEVPVVSVYARQKDPSLDRFVRERRLRFGTGIIFSRQDGMRPALRALRQGHSLFYLPDQDHGERDSVFADFFGVPAATLTGLSRIAAMTDAAVLPCYPRRERDGYTLVIEPALADFPSADLSHDAARMNAVIEAQVLPQRAQYFWLHRRFKTRPAGAAPVY
jgi:Kdo2-lipid IVA lauroyltransferase/acyltransferase